MAINASFVEAFGNSRIVLSHVLLFLPFPVVSGFHEEWGPLAVRDSGSLLSTLTSQQPPRLLWIAIKLALILSKSEIFIVCSASYALY